MVKFMKPPPDSTFRKGGGGDHDDKYKRYLPPVEEKPPPMCGKGVIDKVLRKPSGKKKIDKAPRKPSGRKKERGASDNSLQTRNFRLKPSKSGDKYAKVPGGVMSPVSESGSIERRNDKLTKHIIESVDSGVDLVQFDPKELEVSMDDDASIEVTHTPKKKSSPLLSPFVGWLSPSSDTSSKKEKAAEESKSPKSIVREERKEEKVEETENYEVLAAMRELVLRQQAALKRLSEKNFTISQELEHREKTLEELAKEKERHKQEINKLETEKVEAEAETASLREEMQGFVEGELSKYRRKGRRQVFKFGSSSESVSSDGGSRGILSDSTYNDIGGSAVWDGVVPSVGESYSSRTPDSSEFDDDTEHTETDDSRSEAIYSRRPLINEYYDEIAESRSDVIYSSRGSSVERRTGSSPDRKSGRSASPYRRKNRRSPRLARSARSPRSVSRTSTRSAMSGRSARSDRSAKSDGKSISTAQISVGQMVTTNKPTKEEVELFRQRLATIQQRRMDRRSERQKRTANSRPVVRFGASSYNE